MSQSPPSNDQTAPLVAPFAQFGHTHIALAGGKGANLGELVRAGFDVPPGFIITTATYDLLLQNNGLHARLDSILASLNPGDPASVTQVSERMRQALQAASIPQQVVSQVLEAYRRLGGGAVAVRSSATAEDLAGAAFAGQQETFLNVIGEPALLEAVRDCWASLWSERAVLYRARQNVDQATVKLAVVVQRLVPADAAGVMFTANPVNGASDEIVIDANPGLGEAVVSGQVTPDHFVVARRQPRQIQQVLGRREIIVRPRAGGGTEQITPTPGVEVRPALPPAAVRELARLGVAIESHYSAPQDIEWAWVKEPAPAGHIFILQARPVTALPKPLKVNRVMRQIIPMLVEMLPARPYPLDITTFTGTVEHAVRGLLVEMIGQSAPDPAKLYIEEDGVITHFEPPEMHFSPAILITPWLALWRTRHYNPLRWETDPLLAEAAKQACQLDQIDLRVLTWKQNIETLHAALALIPRFMELRQRYFPPALAGLARLWLLLHLARQGSRFGGLLAGAETKTTETNRRLEELAAHIRRDPELRILFASCPAGELRATLADLPQGTDFLINFDAFLDQYGHREVSLTISQGAWRDQPEIVLGILKVLAASEPQAADSRPAWMSERDALLKHSILGIWPLRSPFLKALAYARCLFQIREDTHFYATLAQPPIRHIALELGRRLKQAGALDEVEDVFHLRLEELEASGEPWPPSTEILARIRALVSRRKARRETLAATPLVDPRLLAVAPHAAPGEAVLLNGSPGSPGVASGPVRIVLDSSQFTRLQPGDVLVAPATNPAWTPLFQRAAAVVVDTGGAASHAAIVAREYGVPAVMGTIDGTRLLKDGQRVRVDGSRGLVLIAEEPT